MSEPMTRTINHHQALIYTMVTMIGVDGRVGNAELARIGRLVQTLPAFSGFDPERLTHVAQECGEILQEETGLETVLALVKDGARIDAATFARPTSAKKCAFPAGYTESAITASYCSSTCAITPA